MNHWIGAATALLAVALVSLWLAAGLVHCC